MKKTQLGRYERASEDSEPPENFVRVYLAESETGWVEILDRSSVRIANIPYDGMYNIDDVVHVADTMPLRYAPVKILTGPVTIRPFPVRTILAYPAKDLYPKIRKMLEEAGGKMEGIMSPSAGAPGFISMAAKSEADVIGIVEKFALEQEEGWQPNFLEPI